MSINHNRPLRDDADHDNADYDEIPAWPDLEMLERVDDFLPPPDQLIYRSVGAQPVTVELAEETARYFYERSQESGVSHRLLIQSLLNSYVVQQREKANASAAS